MNLFTAWVAFGVLAVLAGLFVHVAASVARGEIGYLVIFGALGIGHAAWKAWRKK